MLNNKMKFTCIKSIDSPNYDSIKNKTVFKIT